MYIEISIFTWKQCCKGVKLLRLKVIKIPYMLIVHVSATCGVHTTGAETRTFHTYGILINANLINLTQ